MHERRNKTSIFVMIYFGTIWAFGAYFEGKVHEEPFILKLVVGLLAGFYMYMLANINTTIVEIDEERERQSRYFNELETKHKALQAEKDRLLDRVIYLEEKMRSAK